ncbi:MAG: hypothetical protein WDW38_005039 [Sanguina aurantia]
MQLGSIDALLAGVSLPIGASSIHISALDPHSQPAPWSLLNAKEASRLLSNSASIFERRSLQPKSVQFSLKLRKPGSAYHSPDLPAALATAASPARRPSQQPAVAERSTSLPPPESNLLHSAFHGDSPRSPPFLTHSPEPRPKSYPGNQPTARPLWPAVPHLRPGGTGTTRTVSVQDSFSGQSLVTEAWATSSSDHPVPHPLTNTQADHLNNTNGIMHSSKDGSTTNRRDRQAHSPADAHLSNWTATHPPPSTPHDPQRYYDLLAPARLQMATACCSAPVSDIPTDSATGALHALPLNPTSLGGGMRGPGLNGSGASPACHLSAPSTSLPPGAGSPSCGLRYHPHQCQDQNPVTQSHLQSQNSLEQHDQGRCLPTAPIPTSLSGASSPAGMHTAAPAPHPPHPTTAGEQGHRAATLVPPPSLAGTLTPHAQPCTAVAAPASAFHPLLRRSAGSSSSSSSLDGLTSTNNIDPEATFQTVHQILSTISPLSRFPAEESAVPSEPRMLTDETTARTKAIGSMAAGSQVSAATLGVGTHREGVHVQGSSSPQQQALPSMVRQTLEAYTATAEALTLAESFALLGLNRGGGSSSSHPPSHHQSASAGSPTSESDVRAPVTTSTAMQASPAAQRTGTEPDGFLHALLLRAVAKILLAKALAQGAAGSTAHSHAQHFRSALRESARCAAYALALRLGIPKARLRLFPVQDATGTGPRALASAARARTARLALGFGALQRHAAWQGDLAMLVEQLQQGRLVGLVRGAWARWRSALSGSGALVRAAAELDEARLHRLCHSTLLHWSLAAQRRSRLRTILASASMKQLHRATAAVFAALRSHAVARRLLRRCSGWFARRQLRKRLLAWHTVASGSVKARSARCVAVTHAQAQLKRAALAHWRCLRVGREAQRVWRAALEMRRALLVKGKVVRVWHCHAARCRAIIARAAAAAAVLDRGERSMASLAVYSQMGNICQSGTIPGQPSVPPPLSLARTAAGIAALLEAARLHMEALSDELLHLQRHTRFRLPPPQPGSDPMGHHLTGCLPGQAVVQPRLLIGQWQHKHDVMLLLTQLEAVECGRVRDGNQMDQAESGTRMARAQLCHRMDLLHECLHEHDARLLVLRSEQAGLHLDLRRYSRVSHRRTTPRDLNGHPRLPSPAPRHGLSRTHGVFASLLTTGPGKEASDAAEQAATVREELGELEASRLEVDDAHRHALHTSAALEAAVQSSAQDCAAAEADMQRAQREVAVAEAMSRAVHEQQRRDQSPQPRLEEALSVLAMLQQRVREASPASPSAAAAFQAPMRDLLLVRVRGQAAEAQRVVGQLQGMVASFDASASKRHTAQATAAAALSSATACLSSSASSLTAARALSAACVTASAHHASLLTQLAGHAADLGPRQTAAEGRVRGLQGGCSSGGQVPGAGGGAGAAHRGSAAVGGPGWGEAAGACSEVAYRTLSLQLQPGMERMTLDGQLYSTGWTQPVPPLLVSVVKELMTRHGISGGQSQLPDGSWQLDNLPRGWEPNTAPRVTLQRPPHFCPLSPSATTCSSLPASPLRLPQPRSSHPSHRNDDITAHPQQARPRSAPHTMSHPHSSSTLPRPPTSSSMANAHFAVRWPLDETRSDARNVAVPSGGEALHAWRAGRAAAADIATARTLLGPSPSSATVPHAALLASCSPCHSQQQQRHRQQQQQQDQKQMHGQCSQPGHRQQQQQQGVQNQQQQQQQQQGCSISAPRGQPLVSSSCPSPSSPSPSPPPSPATTTTTITTTSASPVTVAALPSSAAPRTSCVSDPVVLTLAQLQRQAQRHEMGRAVLDQVGQGDQDRERERHQRAHVVPPWRRSGSGSGSGSDSDSHSTWASPARSERGSPTATLQGAPTVHAAGTHLQHARLLRRRTLQQQQVLQGQQPLVCHNQQHQPLQQHAQQQQQLQEHQQQQDPQQQQYAQQQSQQPERQLHAQHQQQQQRAQVAGEQLRHQQPGREDRTGTAAAAALPTATMTTMVPNSKTMLCLASTTGDRGLTKSGQATSVGRGALNPQERDRLRFPSRPSLSPQTLSRMHRLRWIQARLWAATAGVAIQLAAAPVPLCQAVHHPSMLVVAVMASGGGGGVAVVPASRDRPVASHMGVTSMPMSRTSMPVPRLGGLEQAAAILWAGGLTRKALQVLRHLASERRGMLAVAVQHAHPATLRRTFHRWASCIDVLSTAAGRHARRRALRCSLLHWRGWAAARVWRAQALAGFLALRRGRSLRGAWLSWSLVKLRSVLHEARIEKLTGWRVQRLLRAWQQAAQQRVERRTCLEDAAHRGARATQHRCLLTWGQRTRDHALLRRVFARCEAAWDSLEAAPRYGDEYQLLSHTLQRWQHFVSTQLAKRADRVSENAADAFRTCRVLVSAFAAMQAAVSQAWEQRHAAHLAHRTFRAWKQHARHTSQHPSSRTNLRTRLRQNGIRIQHEGLIYPTSLSRRVLLAWIGILDPAGAWRAQRLLRRCWSQWRLLCRRREASVASRVDGGEGTRAALRPSGESRLSGRAVGVSGGIQREAALWYDRQLKRRALHAFQRWRSRALRGRSAWRLASLWSWKTVARKSLRGLQRFRRAVRAAAAHHSARSLSSSFFAWGAVTQTSRHGALQQRVRASESGLRCSQTQRPGRRSPAPPPSRQLSMAEHTANQLQAPQATPGATVSDTGCCLRGRTSPAAEPPESAMSGTVELGAQRATPVSAADLGAVGPGWCHDDTGAALELACEWWRLKSLQGVFSAWKALVPGPRTASCSQAAARAAARAGPGLESGVAGVQATECSPTRLSSSAVPTRLRHRQRSLSAVPGCVAGIPMARGSGAESRTHSGVHPESRKAPVVGLKCGPRGAGGDAADHRFTGVKASFGFRMVSRMPSAVPTGVAWLQ